MASARASVTRKPPEFIIANGAELHPNPWNPNRMTAFIYSKALESIQTFGFIDPITAFRFGNGYTIIDGEHRWRAGMDLGIKTYPVMLLDVTEDEAKKLTIVFNELHGQADPEKLTSLLSELLDSDGMDNLIVALPFSEEVLAGLLASVNVELPDMPSFEEKPRKEIEDRWVERLLRMPEAVGNLFDDALTRAAEGEDIKDWQKLERVLADYLAQ